MESSPVATATANESGSVPASMPFGRRSPSTRPMRSMQHFFANPPSSSVTAAGAARRPSYTPAASAFSFSRGSSAAAARQSAPAAAGAPSSAFSSRGRKRRAEDMELSDDVAPRRSTRVKKIKSELKQPPPSLKAPPPSSKPEDDDDDGDKKPAAREGPAPSCCICMCDVEPQDLSVINGCEHEFCFECIAKWSERENSCPLCKKRFTKIERVSKKKVKGQKQSKKVKARDQRADLMPGSALESILASLARNNGSGGPGSDLARLMFSITNGREGLPPPGRFAVGTSAGSSASSPLELDSDDEDSPFSLTRVLAGRSLASASRGSPGATSTFRLSFTQGPNGFSFSSSAVSSNPPRSHASNANDATAGNQENPLEILDSDSDDEVEIIAVRQPRTRSSRRSGSRSETAPAAGSSRAARATRRSTRR